jgi:hypothetical protein
MMMTNFRVTTPTREPDQAGNECPSAASTTHVQSTDSSSDAIDGEELLRILEGDSHLLADLEPAGDAPKVRRMPEGIEVFERQIGLAAGQWVLRVRCQCGRSWFEVEEVHWSTCPRCSLLVRVNIDARQR